MTATASHPEAGYVAHQGEPRWYGDNLFEFLIPEEVTGGRISVFVATCRAGFAPPRHIHTGEDEVFHILGGDVDFEIDGRRQLAGPGTSIWMPRGVPHGFRVKSPVARMLGVITPGGFEHLFRDLSIPAAERALPPVGASPLDPAAIMAEQIRLGTQVVGPPMQAED